MGRGGCGLLERPEKNPAKIATNFISCYLTQIRILYRQKQRMRCRCIFLLVLNNIFCDFYEGPFLKHVI